MIELIEETIQPKVEDLIEENKKLKSLIKEIFDKQIFLIQSRINELNALHKKERFTVANGNLYRQALKDMATLIDFAKIYLDKIEENQKEE